MFDKKYHHVDLRQYSILVTGGAGFIGSNIVEYLLKYEIGKVRILDNLSTGYLKNIEKFLKLPNVEFYKGDIRDLEVCINACKGMDYILHQAALGSVPRSINDPLTTNNVNINGFLNMLMAMKEHKIKRMIYAASSSTYGDSKELPKVEERIGKPLSPYAVTKYVNELYAEVFSNTYSLELIGLRYFNVFGPNQSPEGPYAAVIPLFIKSVRAGSSAYINGDGEQTRDFTFVENAVQANIKAMLSEKQNIVNQVYNVACGERISLNTLWKWINEFVGTDIPPIYREGRKGDIKDSLADVNKISSDLGYTPAIKVKEGLKYLIWN